MPDPNRQLLFVVIAVLIFWALTGCAGTKYYRNGQLVLSTQADADEILIQDGRTRFYARNLNHSRPTTAGGASTAKVIQSTGAAASAIGAAVITRGVVK